jgi:hypothetical protein
MNDRIQLLNELSNSKCKREFQNLPTSVQHVSAILPAIAVFKNRPYRNNYERLGNSCYNCHAVYIRNCLKFFASAVKTIDLEAPSLLFEFVMSNTSFISQAVDTLVAFCHAKWEVTRQIAEIVTQSLPNVSPHLVRLLSEIEKITDANRKNRLPILVGSLRDAVRFAEIGAVEPDDWVRAALQ